MKHELPRPSPGLEPAKRRPSGNLSHSIPVVSDSIAGSALSRRSVFRSLAAATSFLAIGGGLSACGGGQAADGSMQTWDLFSGADGVSMRSMITNFSNAEGVNVRPVTLAWGSPYYTKLAMAASSGKAPDTAIMHLSRMAGFAPGGLLEPYDLDLLAEFGVHEEDFAPAVWENCHYDGQLFAVPLDTHPFIVFYNKDIAEQAGVLDSSGALSSITSAADMLDVGQKLAGVTGKQGISFGHVLDSAQPWRLFWGLYGQTGGGYTIEVGSPAVLDTAKAEEVLTFLTKMMDGKIALKNQTYAGGIADFTSGTTGLILSGVWELPALQAAVPNLGAVPMPTMFGTPANYADSHSYVLPRQVSDDPQRRRTAHQFVAGIIKQGQKWAEAGHIPAFLPVQAGPGYQKLHPQVDYAAAGTTPVFDPPVWFSGAGTDFQNQLSQTISACFQGTLDPASAVASMLEIINKMLSAPNPI